jgi:hypothetical protein
VHDDLGRNQAVNVSNADIIGDIAVRHDGGKGNSPAPAHQAARGIGSVAAPASGFN